MSVEGWPGTRQLAARPSAIAARAWPSPAQFSSGPAKRGAQGVLSPRTAWRLAAVEVEAFSRCYCYGSHGRLRLRAAMLVAILLYERRTHPSGMALCLLGRRRARVAALIALSALGALVVGALAPQVSGCLLAVLGVLALRPAIRSVRALRASAELRRAVPPGPYKYVHSLASTLPGAGAELLRALSREADEKGWSLVLDASDNKLARYYATCGFMLLSRGATMPDGAARLRMWRPPSEEA